MQKLRHRKIKLGERKRGTGLSDIHEFEED